MKFLWCVILDVVLEKIRSIKATYVVRVKMCWGFVEEGVIYFFGGGSKAGGVRKSFFEDSGF